MCEAVIPLLTQSASPVYRAVMFMAATTKRATKTTRIAGRLLVRAW